MTSIAMDARPTPTRPNFENGSGKTGLIVFLALLIVGLVFAAFSVSRDIAATNTNTVAIGAYFLLGLALLIALAFEFVNGFHDTANAVASRVCGISSVCLFLQVPSHSESSHCCRSN